MRFEVRGVKNCQTRIKKGVEEDARRAAKSRACGPGSDGGVRPYIQRLWDDLRLAGFHFQQRLLAPDPPAIATEFSIGAQDAMAGNGDGDWVGGAGAGHGAHSGWPANGFGDLGVGTSLTECDGLQIRPHPTLESGRLNIER